MRQSEGLFTLGNVPLVTAFDLDEKDFLQTGQGGVERIDEMINFYSFSICHDI